MALLELRNVSKGFGKGGSRTEILLDVNLSIAEGECVAIIGFSGTGKTTLISMLAGLKTPDSGQVLMKGKSIRHPGPDRGVVSKKDTLVPWLSVFENMQFAIQQVTPNVGQAELYGHTRKYISLFKLGQAANKRPNELSAGMRQRASIAKTIATQPEILLMDEPFAGLDSLTRVNLRTEIANIFVSDRRSLVLTTDSVDEAILMADRVIPLLPGTGKGATLGEPIAVDIGRPRSKEMPAYHDGVRLLEKTIVAALRRARTSVQKDDPQKDDPQKDDHCTSSYSLCDDS